MRRRASVLVFAAMNLVAVLSWVLAGCGGGAAGGDGREDGGEGGRAPEQTAARQETAAPEEEKAALVADVTDAWKVEADRHFAGKVEGTDAFLGVALREGTDEFIAYLCDGPTGGPVEGVTHTWFTGPLPQDGRVDLAQDGDRLRARVARDGVAGTVEFGGGEAKAPRGAYAFEAEPVPADGEAGLYWGEKPEETGLTFRPGTIVLANGEERGTTYPPYVRCAGRSILAHLLASFGFAAAGVCVP